MEIIRYLKLFLVYAQIILEAKNILVLVDKYNPQEMEALLRRLYRLLPQEARKEYGEEEFVRKFLAGFRLLCVLVDALWYFAPGFMHWLTWKYVDLTQAGWRKFIGYLRRFAQESEEDLNKKIEYYQHEYEKEVLAHLLDKDFEVQRKFFELRLRRQIKAEIEKLKEKFEKPISDDWLYSYDHNGLHENPNREVPK